MAGQARSRRWAKEARCSFPRPGADKLGWDMRDGLRPPRQGIRRPDRRYDEVSLEPPHYTTSCRK